MTEHEARRLPDGRHAATRWLAAAAILLCATVLVGWIVGERSLLQPVELFPALRPLSALVMLAFASGILCIETGRRAWVRPTTIALLTLAIVELASAALPGNPLDRLFERWSDVVGVAWQRASSMIPSAFSPLFAYALLVMNRRATSSRSLLAVVGIGLFLIAVAVGIALFNAASVSGAPTMTLIRGSVQGMSAALLIGAALLVMVAQRQEVPRLPPAGSPELAGVLALSVAVLLWSSLARREERLLSLRAQLVAHGAEAQVRARLQQVRNGMPSVPRERAALLASAIDDSSSGFRTVLSSDESGATLSSRTGAAGFTVASPSDTLRFVVVPTETELRHVAVLPTIILIFGTCVAGLVTLVLRMLRDSWRQARELELARVQRALDYGSDGVWEFDFETGLGRRSPTQLRHLGFDPAWFNAQPNAWRHQMHPDEVDGITARLELARHDPEEVEQMQYRVRAADGSWHTIVDRGRVVERLPDGSAKLMLGISADVTERLRADEQREASERRFRAMFDSALHGQTLLDLGGRCEEINSTALQIIGAERKDIIGTRFMQGPWFTGLQASQSVLEEQFQRAANGSPVHFAVDAHLIDGRLGLLECSFTPLTGADGDITQVLCEMRDVTERRRADEALREIGSITAMGRMAARVAHEINNPLAGIQNSYLLLADAVPESHPHHRFVAAMEREIGRIASITRQLYETYRVDVAESTESSLLIAVNDAVSFLDQVNRGRGIRIRTDLARAPSRVPLPDALLRQMLYNLLQNAVEASPIGGTVWVRARQEGAHCVLTVSDEGIGIAPELRERIWEPFFSTKDPRLKTNGIGLGLALVKQSVAAVGGTITLLEQSTPGATFEVRLPMASAAAPAQL